MKTIRTNVLLLLAYFALSLGIFYGGSKFHVPWYGSNDFSEYYRMVERPFDNDTGAPYGYRVVTPTVAHYVEKYGLFYNSDLTPYKDNYLEHDGVSYRPSTLSALIFTNFLFLVLSAFFTSKTISQITPGGDLRDKMLAIGLPSLIFLSLSTVVHGYGGLTEGGTLFFVSLLCYLLHRDKLALFSLCSFVSVLQRELVPLAMFVFILVLPGRTDRRKFLVVCLLAFASYFFLRVAFPLAGYEEQLRVSSIFANLMSFRLTKAIILQAILANNIAFFILLSAFVVDLRNIKAFLPYIAVAFCLAALGAAEGIGNNIGRIVNIATPLLIICVVQTYSLTAVGWGAPKHKA